MPLPGGPPVGFPIYHGDDFGYAPQVQPFRAAPPPVVRPRPRPAPPRREPVAQRPVEVPPPDALGIDVQPGPVQPLVIPPPDQLGIDPN